MFITFSMAVMRMSGAIGFNPLFGKSNFPVKIRAYFIFALSLLLYLSADQTQMAYPGSMAEYILMLAGELFLGAVLAFAMGTGIPYDPVCFFHYGLFNGT